MRRTISAFYFSIFALLPLVFSGCGLNAQSSAGGGTTLSTDGKSSKNLQIPKEKFGPFSGPVAPAAPAPSKQTDLETTKVRPVFVILKAQPIERLTVLLKRDGENMTTALSGKLVIQSVEPDIGDPSLSFGDATSVQVVIPDLRGCELAVKNFTMPKTASKQIEFLLTATDQIQNANQDSCLVKLSTMSITGFSVEFDNVGFGTSTVMIPKVRLDVSPAR